MEMELSFFAKTGNGQHKSRSDIGQTVEEFVEQKSVLQKQKQSKNSKGFVKMPKPRLQTKAKQLLSVILQTIAWKII
jgi:hypothetical protein